MTASQTEEVSILSISCVVRPPGKVTASQTEEVCVLSISGVVGPPGKVTASQTEEVSILSISCVVRPPGKVTASQTEEVCVLSISGVVGPPGTFTTSESEEVISTSRINVGAQKLSMDESSGLEELFGTPRLNTIKLRHDTSSSDASLFTAGNVLKKAKVDPKPTGQEDKDLIDVQLLSIQTSLCENVEKLNKNAERIAIACEGICNRVETGNAYWKFIADYMDIKIKEQQRDVDQKVDQTRMSTRMSPIMSTLMSKMTQRPTKKYTAPVTRTLMQVKTLTMTSIQEDDLKDKSPESITF